MKTRRDPLTRCVTIAAMILSALAAGPAPGGEAEKTTELSFRAGDGSPFSAIEDLTLITTRPGAQGYERDPATDPTPYLISRKPAAAVDRYHRGQWDASYVLRLPKLFGVDARQVPADPGLIVQATLVLHRVPTPGYFPADWDPKGKVVKFALYRLTDPDGLGPWWYPPEIQPNQRLFAGGACGAFRDGRATICDEPAWTSEHPFAAVGKIRPGGRPWTKDGGNLENARVLEAEAPYQKASLVYEFNVTASLKAWAAGQLNEGWAVQESTDSQVSGRGDWLFHASDAADPQVRPLLKVTVKPRPVSAQWKAKEGVEHPFYYTPDDIRRARANVEKHPWARKHRDSAIAAAEKWAKMSDAELSALIPQRTWTRTAIAPSVWNSGELLDVCPIAYVLTGDRRYAHPVALVLVRLAQAWPGWPLLSTEGPGTEYAAPGAKQPPYNTTAHRGSGVWGEQKLLMFAAIAYDLTYGSGEYEAIGQRERFDAKGLIETDFLANAARFYSNRSHSLGNFDGYKIAALACAARAAGEPELVHATLRLLRLMLANNFYRDGFWCERTSGYHEQTLNFSRAAEALMDYSDPPGFTSQLDGTRLDRFNPYIELPLARAYTATLWLMFPNRDTARFNDTSPREGWMPELYSILAHRTGRADLPLAAEGQDRDRFSLFHLDPEARPQTRPVPELEQSGILPASGFVTFRSGRGVEKATALFFTYGGASSSHRHSDPLSFVLFARGHELLADLGYTHTYLRYSWPATTAAHSTVLVNEQLSDVAPGELRLFAPAAAEGPSVQVVQANQTRAYAAAGATLYDRTLALVAADGGDAYLLDIFRVAGGRQHDYMLQPGPQPQQKLAFENLAPTSRRGTLAGENTVYAGGRSGGSEYERKDWYTYITDIQHAATPERCACSWQLPDGVGCRATFLGAAGAELFTGLAPAIHFGEDGKLTSNYDDRALADRMKKPVLCLRRKGEGLRSTFVTVLEPFRDKPAIGDAHLLKTAGDPSAVAVRIVSGARTHDVISTLAGAEPAVAEEIGLRLNGQFGLVAAAGEQVEMLFLAGGKELTDSARRYGVRTGGPASGPIEAVRGDLTGEKENVIVTSSAVPVSKALAGRVVLAEHADGTSSAYVIQATRRAGEKTEIVLEPGPCFVEARCRIDRVQAKPPVLHTADSLLRSLDGSLDGKWLTLGNRTLRIKKVAATGRMNVYFPGFNLELADGEDVAAVPIGSEVTLHAVHAGDRFRIPNVVRLTRAGNEWRLDAAEDTEVILPAANGQRALSLCGPDGTWRSIGTRAEGAATITGRVEASNLAAGSARLRVE